MCEFTHPCERPCHVPHQPFDERPPSNAMNLLDAGLHLIGKHLAIPIAVDRPEPSMHFASIGRAVDQPRVLPGMDALPRRFYVLSQTDFTGAQKQYFPGEPRPSATVRSSTSLP